MDWTTCEDGVVLKDLDSKNIFTNLHETPNPLTYKITFIITMVMDALSTIFDLLCFVSIPLYLKCFKNKK